MTHLHYLRPGKRFPTKENQLPKLMEYITVDSPKINKDNFIKNTLHCTNIPIVILLDEIERIIFRNDFTNDSKAFLSSLLFEMESENIRSTRKEC
jgi:hypothetical protein